MDGGRESGREATSESPSKRARAEASGRAGVLAAMWKRGCFESPCAYSEPILDETRGALWNERAIAPRSDPDGAWSFSPLARLLPGIVRKCREPG